MEKILILIAALQAAAAFAACTPELRFDGKKIELTNEEWRQRLPPERYEVLREGGTEPRGTNLFEEVKGPGLFLCAACELPLFSTETKYDSGTGWPSFREPVCQENITLESDYSWLMRRTEVLCSRCGSHIGHVFDDGPPPTGKRYCLNSLALIFNPGFKGKAK